MWRSRDLEASKLEAETRRTYKGSARISLDVLQFRSNEHRDLDAKHVEYLKGCFQKDTCRRLEKRNHIEQQPIFNTSLDAALRDSDVSARELLTNEPNGYPKLTFPSGYKLRCLHGQHRIQAAREYLLPHDKWWTVDLYTSDLNDSLRKCLNEQHSNEDKPTDGEAYCKIREYHFRGDTKSEMRWKASLRGNRLKNLKQLLTDEGLTAGFDALLGIPGLWDGMMMTTLQKMMAMGSKDEILHYLGKIKKTFLLLVGEDEQALARIDRPTVKVLELRAPRASTADAQFLREQIRGGAIFSAFTDLERDQILTRLPMVDGLIQTLFSFFRDLNYLQLLVDCLKRLVIVPKGRSVCEAIQRTYTGVNQQEGQVKIQVAEDAFTYHSGTDVDRVDLGCRQLIALAMRYYPYVPRDPVSGDAVKKATTKADPAVLQRLARLAYEVGFETAQIQTLRRLPNSRVDGDDDPRFSPLYVTCGSTVETRDRSGIPRTKAYQEDRYALFIDNLHDAKAYHGEQITSLFVRRSVYLAFYGRPDGVSTSQTAPSHPYDRDSVFASNRADLTRPLDHDTSQSHARAGYENDVVNDILSSYNRPETMNRFEEASEDTNEHVRYLSNLERQEQERQEQERLEQERQEQERLEQERQEQERQEQERQEQERQEQERQEQERQEQETLEQEIMELRRIEETLEGADLQERLAAALQEQGNIDREKQQQREQEEEAHERQEQERRRQETREKGRREQEEIVLGPERRRKRGYTQIDIEGAIRGAGGHTNDIPVTSEQNQDQAQTDLNQQTNRALVRVGPNTTRDSQPQANDQTGIDEESLARERSEREKQRLQQVFRERLQEEERLEQERREEGKRQQEQREQEKRQEERRQEERRREARRDEGRLEQENSIELERQPNVAEINRPGPLRQQNQTPVPAHKRFWITFKIRERGAWRTAQELLINSSDPSEIERIAVKYMRKKEQMRLYDTDLNILTPEMCFQAAVANRSNVLLLIPERDINISEELEASVSTLLSELDTRNGTGIE